MRAENDKNAVMVTGAASGIGYACVRNLLRDGVSVVAADLADIPVELVATGEAALPISVRKPRPAV